MLTKSLLPLSVLLLRAVGSTLSADLPELPNGLEEGPDGQVLSHRIEDLPHVVKYYEARALNQSETEDDGDAFEKRQIGTDPKPSKASLAGMQTPSGKGTFPNQYITANGGFVWECPLEFWGTEIGGAYDKKCKVTKVQTDVCIKRHWSGAHTTFVPDKDLVCSLFRTDGCLLSPKYNTQDLIDYKIPKDLWQKYNQTVIGMINGITWPGIESFQSQWAIDNRINLTPLTPHMFKCRSVTALSPGIGT